MGIAEQLRCCRLGRVLAAGLVATVTAAVVAVDGHAAERDDEIANDQIANDQIANDPEVIRAREAAADAEAVLGEVTARLDRMVAAYEQAVAHHLRLTEELDDSAAGVAAAAASAASAAQSHADLVAEAYRHPASDAVLAQAVLLAPDAATAMHRVALLERITVRGAAQAASAADLHVQVADQDTQIRVVHAGAEAAAADRQRLADDLAAAVATAEQELATAGEDATEAEAAAAARIEARERAAREAALFAGAGPLPSVDGKVCPIGAPNGFIDSWGFPRSGGRRHQGVDMFAAYGMPLYAVADGEVRRVYTNRLGGLSIDLVDDRGDRYYYAHLSAATVTSGQRVVAGQVIGANGDSGNARGTPPHLHWQYHPGGGPPVNPYPLAVALCR